MWKLQAEWVACLFSTAPPSSGGVGPWGLGVNPLCPEPALGFSSEAFSWAQHSL